MNIKVVVTDSSNTDFIGLIKLLDGDLSQRYGNLQQQYTKHNKLDFMKDVVLIYDEGTPAACGTFKEYDDETVELKRIFVLKELRGQGLGMLILKKLEELAKDKGYKYAVLETGIKQYEAIGLYKKNDYLETENYSPYIGNKNSTCMRKALYM